MGEIYTAKYLIATVFWSVYRKFYERTPESCTFHDFTAILSIL
ncbi:hypothetical protein GVAMD_0646 [Gardnerella vaginalis AMD]|nr:hypothetical protein GVAMD_0646 [Gardnerella vaginalis AMD]